MNIRKTVLISIVLCLHGCASTSDMKKQANKHDKASKYYDSIGQPDAARQENREAQKNRDRANDVIPLLIEIFSSFNNEEDNE